MDAHSELGRAIAAAARTMHHPQTLDETLASIAHAARSSIPGFDEVGISTLHRNGKVQTRAVTGDLVHKLDAAQYELGEGPCVDTLRDAHVVVAPRLRHD